MNRERAVVRRSFHSGGWCCKRGGWALRRTSVLARLARSGAGARPTKKPSPAGPPNQDARRCEPKDNPHSPPPCLLSSRRSRVSARDITLLYSSRYAHPPPAFQPPFVKEEVLRPSEQIAFGTPQSTSGDVRCIPSNCPPLRRRPKCDEHPLPLNPKAHPKACGRRLHVASNVKGRPGRTT